ncbi:MAG TPA: helix-turn-helix domain-containing protein [Pyrinomonadaceae bacterium]
MIRSVSPINRFLISADYSVYYRKVSQLKWESQPSSDYAIVTLSAGELEYTTANEVGKLQPSQALLLEPNTTFKASGKGVEFLLLVISSAIVIQHAVSMRLVPPKSTVSFPHEPVINDGDVNALLARLDAELGVENPGRDIVMRAIVEQLIVQILRRYAVPKRSEELELSRVGLIDRRIRRSVELMHSQLDQELSLRDLAAASYLSPFHFARLFKKLTGVTPHSYLAAIRTNKAQLLLAETELSITEIGVRVGYLSASHFTKAFRSATGTTPREFRKALIHS